MHPNAGQYHNVFQIGNKIIKQDEIMILYDVYIIYGLKRVDN